MTGLRELFEEAAGSPPPPNPLAADAVYTAGRRWRRQRRTVAGLGIAATVAAIAVAAGNLLAPAGPPARQLPIAGPTTPAVADPRPERRMQWAGVADAQHFYLSFSTCSAPARCDKALVQLVGSDDGGRTWTDRGAPVPVGSLVVLGPRTLLGTVLGDATTVMTSIDGGRTWSAARPAAPVAAVPEGGVAVCLPDTAGSSCTLHAVDPPAHLVAPLAAQPPLAVETDHLEVDESDGRLWMGGTDRMTGRPAVTVSADAGRTWSRHVFADAPPCPGEGCGSPSLALGDAGTVYAVTTGAGGRAVYRRTGGATGDGAGWQRLTGADRVPHEAAGQNSASFVTADGTHVLYQLTDRPSRNADGYRYWAARDGGAYREVELDGLPDTAGPIGRTPDGWFYAPSHADGVMYGSTDGWRWSAVTRR